MSFLEMLDVLNEQLNAKGEEPIAFDSDCREGICGMCGLMINGEPHGPEVTTTCQLHMRSFKDGDEITIEPWRADAFPVVKDLCVDRGAFDRIIQQGGYISVNTGAAPEAHSVQVPKEAADRAFDVATCIGCGACVAAWEFTPVEEPGSAGASAWADQMGAPVLHKEDLTYTAIEMKQRSYK
jgi:succinate dehydrogenase / fumarate reductase iron-sulfur subunit